MNQHQTCFSHLDASGAATMVDISGKTPTAREAIANAVVRTRPDVIQLIKEAKLKKGDVFAVARVAGIMAAKKTAEFIPLCHPLALTQATIDFECDENIGAIYIRSCCKVIGQTGIEMEALTAARIAALTIYDMCKAVDSNMEISKIYLVQKHGGKTGTWKKETYHD